MPFIDTPETNALKSKVEKLLSEIPDFTDENKNLKINVIKDYADNGNVKLLEPLLKIHKLKKLFLRPYWTVLFLIQPSSRNFWNILLPVILTQNTWGRKSGFIWEIPLCSTETK